LTAVVKSERLLRGGAVVFERPDSADDADPKLLEYTRLEQPGANRDFRQVVEFMASIRYLHLVPQLVKTGGTLSQLNEAEDYFGSDFIGRMARLNTSTRKSYLRRIEKALRIAVPQFEGLDLVPDERGRQHLQTIFRHWRPQGAKQREDQFSDGTLRLVGFLWSLLEGRGPLLLEEPELSLHPAIVAHLAEMIARLQKKDSGQRQVVATTHSLELLMNPGIAGEEVAALFPSDGGTEIHVAAEMPEVRALLQAGMPVGEAIMPSTAPSDPAQLLLEL
jgi:predicted ATPase